ncbi:MAG TPA: hypothetical protein DIW61_16855 [Candidatus Aminicenantes bacterium]|nr:hypothetical protein [Candidatus Aminicenantes bacterium]
MDIDPELWLDGSGLIGDGPGQAGDDPAFPFRPFPPVLGHDPFGRVRRPADPFRQGDSGVFLEPFQAAPVEAAVGDRIQCPLRIDHLPKDEIADEVQADAVGVELSDQAFNPFKPAVPVVRTGRADEFHPVVLGLFPPVCQAVKAGVLLEFLGVEEDGQNQKNGDALLPGQVPELTLSRQSRADENGVDAERAPFCDKLGKGPFVLVYLDPDHQALAVFRVKAPARSLTERRPMQDSPEQKGDDSVLLHSLLPMSLMAIILESAIIPAKARIHLSG